MNENGMRTRTPYAPGAALLPNLMLLLLISDMTETGQPKMVAWREKVKASPTFGRLTAAKHNGSLSIIDCFSGMHTQYNTYIQ